MLFPAEVKRCNVSTSAVVNIIAINSRNRDLFLNHL